MDSACWIIVCLLLPPPPQVEENYQHLPTFIPAGSCGSARSPYLGMPSLANTRCLARLHGLREEGFAQRCKSLRILRDALPYRWDAACLPPLLPHVWCLAAHRDTVPRTVFALYAALCCGIYMGLLPAGTRRRACASVTACTPLPAPLPYLQQLRYYACCQGGFPIVSRCFCHYPARLYRRAPHLPSSAALYHLITLPANCHDFVPITDITYLAVCILPVPNASLLLYNAVFTAACYVFVPFLFYLIAYHIPGYLFACGLAAVTCP